MQGPNKVLLIYQGNQEVRHVYLNVPHSANPKPSWYGKSVGHYDGDTLVVDTIGLSTKAVIDNYHTPHTEQLHVIERYRVVNDGKTLEVNLEIDDPGTFNAPWKAVQRYNRTAARTAARGEVLGEQRRPLQTWRALSRRRARTSRISELG